MDWEPLREVYKSVHAFWIPVSVTAVYDIRRQAVVRVSRTQREQRRRDGPFLSLAVGDHGRESSRAFWRTFRLTMAVIRSMSQR